MLCYRATKNKTCNFFKSSFTASVSIISEQPSYKDTYVNMQDNDVNMQLVNVNKQDTYLACWHKKMHVNINILHADINNLHVHINKLHIDIY